MDEQPTSAQDLAQIAWDKAISGAGLTPEESDALARSHGVTIAPTLPSSVRNPFSQHVSQGSAPQVIVTTTKTEVGRTLSRLDVTDLLTGENVPNIRLNAIPNDVGMRLNAQMMQACQLQQRSGAKVDLDGFVREFDRLVAPGFMELFTPEQIASLKRADRVLSDAVSGQFARLVLGDRTERLIGHVDAALDAYVAPLIPCVLPLAQESIRRSLAQWKHAMKSPYRNWYYRTAHSAAEDPLIHHRHAAALAMRDPRSFSVGVLDDAVVGSNAGGGFCSSSLMMFIREPGRKLRFAETLAIVHELTHAVRTADDLEKMPRGSYDETRRGMDELDAPFHAVPPNSMIGVMDQDDEAFANELELLTAHIGFGTHNVGQVIHALGADNQVGLANHIATLLELAGPYYAEGGRKEGGKFPKQFSDKLEALYRRLGAHVFHRNVQGTYALSR